jgi:hypothetical protein
VADRCQSASTPDRRAKLTPTGCPVRVLQGFGPWFLHTGHTFPRHPAGVNVPSRCTACHLKRGIGGIAGCRLPNGTRLSPVELQQSPQKDVDGQSRLKSRLTVDLASVADYSTEDVLR